MTGTRWDLLPDIARYYARPALVALVALAGLAAWAYWATKDVR